MAVIHETTVSAKCTAWFPRLTQHNTKEGLHLTSLSLPFSLFSSSYEVYICDVFTKNLIALVNRRVLKILLMYPRKIFSAIGSIRKKDESTKSLSQAYRNLRFRWRIMELLLAKCFLQSIYNCAIIWHSINPRRPNEKRSVRTST